MRKLILMEKFQNYLFLIIILLIRKTSTLVSCVQEHCYCNINEELTELNLTCSVGSRFSEQKFDERSSEYFKKSIDTFRVINSSFQKETIPVGLLANMSINNLIFQDNF